MDGLCLDSHVTRHVRCERPYLFLFTYLFVLLLVFGFLHRSRASVFILEKFQARDGAGALPVQYRPDLPPLLQKNRGQKLIH